MKVWNGSAWLDAYATFPQASMDQWNEAYSWGNPASLIAPAIGSTTTCDFGAARNFNLALNQAVTLEFTNIGTAVGKSGMLILSQDASGGRTFTLPPEAKTPQGGAAIVQYTAANSISVLAYYVVSASVVLVNYTGNYA